MEFFRKGEQPAPHIDLDDLYFNRSSASFLRALRTFPILYNLKLRELEKQVLDDLKNGTYTIHKELYKAYSDNLRKAVSGVFNSPSFGGGKGEVYFDMQQQFEANVSRFAAYKAYRATQLLQQNNGDTTKQKAIFNAYNRYQVAEYNTAVARARTAKQWTDFNADPVKNELYPNLKWIPSRSANPREEHRIFWGKVWAKDDPFWSQNQPGNLWDCKCDWEETDEPTTGGSYNYRPPNGLEGNPAQTGEIFTDKASYFKVSAKTSDKIESSTVLSKEAVNNAKFLYDKKQPVNMNGKEVEIEFNSRGINHIARDLIGDDMYFLKNQIMPYMDRYLKNGEYVAWEDNKKSDKKKGALKYHYFQITMPDGKTAYLNVEENAKGKYILYSITNKLRKTATFVQSPA